MVRKKVLLFIILIVGLLVLIVTSLLTNINHYTNSYESYEQKLLEEARKYITNQNIKIESELYINIKRLYVDLKDNCDVTSGVLVDKDYNYNVLLYCDDYKSKFVTEDNSLLNGNNVIVLPLGVKYTEEGLKNNINYQVNGNVEDKVGIYNLQYLINNTSGINTPLIRKVIVVDNKEISGLYPKLKLSGDEIITLDEGTIYNEMGVSATDNYDKDISNKVQIKSNVNINKIGEYEVLYSVTNSKGYTSSIIRKVNIISKESTTILNYSLSNTKPTNEDVIINLIIEGEDYSYVKLPDESTTNEQIVSYKVSENGTYKFITHDKNNKSATFEVIVDNIDKVKPTGTCIATVYPTYTNIVVNSTGTKKISEYGYIINNQTLPYNKSSSYKYNKTDINAISVNLKDSVNNITKINCNVKYIDPSMNNKNVTYYKMFNTEYVIPKTPNTIDNFIKHIRGKISQRAPGADEYNCGNKCDIVSKYYVYYWKYVKDYYSMSLYSACVYGYSHYISYNTVYQKDLKEYMKLIYNEINAGRPVVAKVINEGVRLQHYVMIIGYKRGVYSANDIKESDFLFVNPTTGYFSCSDRKLSGNSYWFLNSTKGYEVLTIKSLKK